MMTTADAWVPAHQAGVGEVIMDGRWLVEQANSQQIISGPINARDME